MTVRRRVAVAAGLAGGGVGALLGGGTGVVTVPVLDRLTTLRRGTIHGTANLVNAAVAVVGSVIYAVRGGHVDMTLNAGLMADGVAGAFVGARIAARAGDQALQMAFAAVLAAAGVELCLGAVGIGPSSRDPLLPGGLRRDTRGGAGAHAGDRGGGRLVGGDGTGRGALTVPILVLCFGLAAHSAEGTSLLVRLPNSVAASVQHLRQGTASAPLGATMACGAAPGAVVGASLGLALSGTVLGWVFGLFVLFVAAREVRRMLPAR